MLLRRRDLLIRAAAGGGALAMFYGNAPGSIARASVLSSGLTAPRRRTYTALVRAVGQAGDSAVDPTRALHATHDFTAYYDRFIPSAQAYVNHILDSIESLPTKAGFSDLTPPTACEALRAWAREGVVQGHPPKVPGRLCGDSFVGDSVGFRWRVRKAQGQTATAADLLTLTQLAEATASKRAPAGFIRPSARQAVAAHAVKLAALPFYTLPTAYTPEVQL